MNPRTLVQLVVIDVCFIGLGAAMGAFLDGAVWTLSHDYVYPASQFRSVSWIFGLGLGTIAAVAIPVNRWHRDGFLKALLAGVVVLLTITVIVAVGFYAVEKWTPLGLGELLREDFGESPLSSPRHQFCRGLVWGSLLGSVLGTIVLVTICRMNPPRVSSQSVSSNSESAAPVSESDS